VRSKQRHRQERELTLLKCPEHLDFLPADRPAASDAFASSDPVNERAAYDSVVLGSLLWEGAPRPSFDECCHAVRQFSSGL